ncbi:hypothetical protein ACQJBY_070113 [Aegilops geniculata]
MAAANAFTSASMSCAPSLSGSVNVIAVCPRSVAAARTLSSSCLRPARCTAVGTAAPVAATAEGDERRFEQLAVPPELVDELVEEALVWCSQHGLVVGDKNHPVT